MQRDAVFSPCGRYRYLLTRSWGEVPIWIAFVGLNPSTADASQDDPTIRRCIRFAKDLGFTGLAMLNLFALRATDPKALSDDHDPIGPGNDEMIKMRIGGSSALACWGADVRAFVRRRAAVVMSMCSHWECLGTTKDGSPRHPLYLPASARPQALARLAEEGRE